MRPPRTYMQTDSDGTQVQVLDISECLADQPQPPCRGQTPVVLSGRKESKVVRCKNDFGPNQPTEALWVTRWINRGEEN